MQKNDKILLENLISKYGYNKIRKIFESENYKTLSEDELDEWFLSDGIYEYKRRINSNKDDEFFIDKWNKKSLSSKELLYKQQQICNKVVDVLHKNNIKYSFDYEYFFPVVGAYRPIKTIKIVDDVLRIVVGSDTTNPQTDAECTSNGIRTNYNGFPRRQWNKPVYVDDSITEEIFKAVQKYGIKKVIVYETIKDYTIMQKLLKDKEK